MKQERIDKARVLETTEGNKTLAAKYIGIFLSSAPVQLDNIQKALATNDAVLLRNTLHKLKPDIELMGIQHVLPQLKQTEILLSQGGRINEAIKTSASFMFDEITLACDELEVIRKNYL